MKKERKKKKKEKKSSTFAKSLFKVYEKQNFLVHALRRHCAMGKKKKKSKFEKITTFSRGRVELKKKKNRTKNVDRIDDHRLKIHFTELSTSGAYCADFFYYYSALNAPWVTL